MMGCETVTDVCRAFCVHYGVLRPLRSYKSSRSSNNDVNPVDPFMTGAQGTYLEKLVAVFPAEALFVEAAGELGRPAQGLLSLGGLVA